jgi:hypothetical protein
MMPPPSEMRRGPAQVRPSNAQAATKPLDKNSLSAAADIAAAYVVIVVSPYGQPRRRPYLSLHHATQAVQRAHAKGQPARLVLCKLEPVAGDLGEWTA